MSKRIADKQLTDRNWEDDDEPEDVGEFRKASDDVIKERMIKTARRRVINNDDSKPSAFAGFAGFGSKAPAVPAPDLKASFSFGKVAKTDGASKPLFSFKAASSETTSTSAPLSVPLSNNVVKPNNDVFLKKLKKLNESVIKFAQDHVSKNPFVILSNVFNDYEKHLKRIQSKEYSSNVESSPKFNLQNKTDYVTVANAVEPAEEKTPEKPEVQELAEESVKLDANPFLSKTPAFSFGTTSDASGLLTGGFGFKATESAIPITSGFSFKSTAPTTTSLFGAPTATSFSGFGGLVAAGTTPQEKKVPEEEEAPPVSQKVDHIDKEAIYHIKCKLFLKTEDGWNEKGVGIANLKECNEKVQLLIRNDTTMGTVILNTLLHDKLPISRSGKNSLMLVVTDEDAKTDTFLVRVNKDKLEEFYEKLEECKKGLPAKD